MCMEEEKKERGEELPYHPLCAEQPAWSWGGICKYSQSVCLPLQRQSNSTLLLAHTPSLMQSAEDLKGRALSAGLTHAYVCVCVCLCGAETFLETHLHTLPSFPLSYSPLSPFPSSSTPLCCFPCPSSSPLPLQPQLFLLLCPVCSDCG